MRGGEYSGTGYRSGAITTMMAQPKCGFLDCQMVSGHELTQYSNLFHYVHMVERCLVVGSGALANKLDPRIRSFTPRYQFMSTVSFLLHANCSLFFNVIICQRNNL